MLFIDCGIVFYVDVLSVELFYWDCVIVVCLIFFGGGMCIKLLEVMVYGCLIVLMIIGVEGLGMWLGEYGLIVDDMGDFVDVVIWLFDDCDFVF